MSNEIYTDEKLNLFMDKQLDSSETDAIHQAILKDSELSMRMCQLKAVRELVRYAYESTPVSDANLSIDKRKRSSRFVWRSVAASALLLVGAITGWMTNNYAKSEQIVSADDVFDYFKQKGVVDQTQRKIVIEVSTGDVAAVNNALNEVEQLLTSYSNANTPMQLDIVTYRDGINMLRLDGSPYIERIEKLLEQNDNFTIYACKNSIQKAAHKVGKEVVLIPQAITTKTAKELVSERIKKGWVYIKV